MSLVIVKNLPKKITETKVRALFDTHGTITNCSLKFNSEGGFRRFAFIGFAEDEQAAKAIDTLNNTFVDTSRIQVQLANDLTQSTKKPAKASAAVETLKVKTKPEKLKVKKHASSTIIGDLEEDEGFQEFLDIHKSGNNKTSWKNDDETVNSKLSANNKHRPVAVVSKEENKKNLAYAFEGESDSSDDESPPTVTAEQSKEEEEEKEDEVGSVMAKDKNLSDMDYLRKKAGAVSHLSDDDEEVTTPSPTKQSDVKKEKRKRERKKRPDYIVKLKGLPLNSNKFQIQSFLQGITIKRLDIPRTSNRTVGVAFVTLKSQTDMDAALRRSRNCIGTKKVTVMSVEDKKDKSEETQTVENEHRKPRPWELKTDLNEVEPIADSGRLFVRNLAHICTEEDLEKLFGEFGNLTEVNLPIDSMSKRIKGFAHITFMFPEHAVKAFNKLDGTHYKGRLLHILPGKPSKNDESNDGDGGNFKKNKQNQQKKTAQSSHNWNSLFLGADAVANVMSSKYGIEKSQLLDSGSSQSLGVRLALGETEVVNETRDFLIEQGVSLDSFSQAAGPRSKTVILVKNMPSKTTVEELKELFSRFGLVARIILPPSGISALVEFQESHEAKAAFTGLAYSKFKHLPLYLEWAPVGVFAKKEAKPGDETKTENDDIKQEHDEQEGKQTNENPDVAKVKTEPTDQPKADQSEESSDDDTETSEGCTLFVKNLNFSTDDDKLKQHFCGCGKVVIATVARKRDPSKPGKALSMGYGFVQFKTPATALKAIKELQNSTLEGHKLELKLSERTSSRPVSSTRKKSNTNKKQTSTKMLVRNIPFQANRKEITELFKVFGELKLVRLPKKVGGQHRGFAFVDFITKNDAKRAFNALCHSTHLFGRRLVLEWADSAEESVDNLRRKTADGYEHERSRKVFKRTTVQSTLEDLEMADDD